MQSFAQFPFEKFPAVKYIKVPFEKGYTETDTTFIAHATYKKYKINITQKQYSNLAHVIIRYKGKVVSVFNTDTYSPLTLQDVMFAADIDGNGLVDFKILFFNDGSGLAGSLEHKLYFFNNGNQKFKPFFYTDFFSFPERDLNGDGNYEIIGTVLTRYGGHSYWTFNLFNYKGGRLINVNTQSNYPLMVQYLFRENYNITNKISRRDMRQFSLKSPDYFQSRKINN